MDDLQLGQKIQTLRTERSLSVRIAPNVPHVWHNQTVSTVKVIFATTPPTF